MARQTPKAAQPTTATPPTHETIRPTPDTEIRSWTVVVSAISVQVGTRISDAGNTVPDVIRLLHGDVLRGRADHPDIAHFLRMASVVPSEQFNGQRLTVAGAARAMGGEIDAAAETLASRPTTPGDRGVASGSISAADL